MKICIFGDNKSYYENKIKSSLEEKNIDVKICHLHDTYLHLGNNNIEIKHRKFDINDFDKFLFWDLNLNYKTQIHRLASYLNYQNKKVIDDILIQKEFDEIDDLIKLKNKGIDVVEFFEVFNIKTARDILIEIEHPIFIKSFSEKKHKEKFILSTDWTDSYDYIRTEKIFKIQLFKKYQEARLVRVYQANTKTVGAIEVEIKIKKTNTSQEIKKFKYFKYEVEDELLDLSQNIAKELNSSICYIEYLKVKDKYIVNDVKRMPKFKIFSKVTGTDYASYIAELLAS